MYKSVSGLIKKKKYIKIALCIALAVLIGIFALEFFSVDKYHSADRVKWKNNAINELRKIDFSSGKPKLSNIQDGWFSPNGVLMKDGSWIVFRSICTKANPKIHDIFIGVASNGKWYYSTYHFCIGAIVILMDDQPESLDSFIKQCHLKEFDGVSDDCLQSTWPK